MLFFFLNIYPGVSQLFPSLPSFPSVSGVARFVLRLVRLSDRLKNSIFASLSDSIYSSISLSVALSRHLDCLISFASQAFSRVTRAVDSR